MKRQLLNGVLGALATLAVIYAIGIVGILTERLTHHSVNNDILMVGVILALCAGVLVLHRRTRRTD